MKIGWGVGLGTTMASVAIALITACGGAAGTDIEGAARDGADGSADALRGDGGASSSKDGGATPPIAVRCSADAAVNEADPASADPATKRVVIGANGTFEDACDSEGNLLKQACATTMICDAPPNPACTSVQTGETTESKVDCAGLCAGGACASSCPVQGDELEVTVNGGGGSVTFKNKRDGRSYACELLSQQGAYDCKTAPTAGGSHLVKGLGLRGTYCTGKDFGNLGTAPTTDPAKQVCSWRCDVTP